MAQIAMVAADITKWIAYGPIRVRGLFGFNAHTADTFIQLHIGPTIAASDVPYVKSVWAATQAPFYWFFGEGIWLPSLMVGISSADPSYTAISAGQGVDMTLVVDSDYLVTSTTTVVGDLTTGVSTLQVWSEATGASSQKKLLALDVLRPGGAAERHTIVFAKDSPVIGDMQDQGILRRTNGTTTVRYLFGKRGVVPYAKEAAGTERKGCTIGFADLESDPANPSLIGGTGFNVRAIYDKL